MVKHDDRFESLFICDDIRLLSGQGKRGYTYGFLPVFIVFRVDVGCHRIAGHNFGYLGQVVKKKKTK